MLRARPALCTAPQDAPQATHTAVRPALPSSRRRCRAPAPAATTPGAGVLESTHVGTAGSGQAVAPPAAWQPKEPAHKVAAPPQRDSPGPGDFGHKHYAQVCQPSRVLAPLPARLALVETADKKVVGSSRLSPLKAGAQSQAPASCIGTRQTL